jgi:hypothetical protein
MTQPFHFYDEAALLERLSKGLKKRSREVIFLVGTPLSAPIKPGDPGVPDVDGVIDLIREEFGDDTAQLSAFDSALGATRQDGIKPRFNSFRGAEVRKLPMKSFGGRCWQREHRDRG